MKLLTAHHSFIHSFFVHTNCQYLLECWSFQKLEINFGQMFLLATMCTKVSLGLLLEFGGFKVIVHIDTLCVPIVNKLIVAILELSKIWIKILEYRFDHQQPPPAMYRLSQLSKVVLYSPFTF